MRRLAAPLLLGLLVLAPTAALAQWPASGSGTSPLVASTMTNATGFTVSCEGAGIRLRWTVSPNVFVEGYEILRTGTGTGSTNRQIRLARADATFLDTDLPTLNGNDQHTYQYTIRSGSTRHAWTTGAVAAPGTITWRASNKGGCSKT